MRPRERASEREVRFSRVQEREPGRREEGEVPWIGACVRVCVVRRRLS